jgi:hypothetical protein
MMKTAVVLADQRIQHGLHPEAPPPPLYDLLGL